MVTVVNIILQHVWKDVFVTQGMYSHQTVSWGVYPQKLKLDETQYYSHFITIFHLKFLFLWLLCVFPGRLPSQSISCLWWGWSCMLLLSVLDTSGWYSSLLELLGILSLILHLFLIYKVIWSENYIFEFEIQMWQCV